MMKRLVLDSTPLALLVQRRGLPAADDCRRWLAKHVSAGVQIVVPEIIDYEVRRELLRMGKAQSIRALDGLVAPPLSERLLRISPTTLGVAAELWAQVRRQGRPTADAAALDIDVILAAQVLTAGWDVKQVRVATSNVKHVGLFVPAAEWAEI